MEASLHFELKATVTEEDGESATYVEAVNIPVWMIDSPQAANYALMAISELASKISDKMQNRKGGDEG